MGKAEEVVIEVTTTVAIDLHRQQAASRREAGEEGGVWTVGVGMEANGRAGDAEETPLAMNPQQMLLLPLPIAETMPMEVADGLHSAAAAGRERAAAAESHQSPPRPPQGTPAKGGEREAAAPRAATPTIS